MSSDSDPSAPASPRKASGASGFKAEESAAAALRIGEGLLPSSKFLMRGAFGKTASSSAASSSLPIDADVAFEDGAGEDGTGSPRRYTLDQVRALLASSSHRGGTSIASQLPTSRWPAEFADATIQALASACGFINLPNGTFLQIGSPLTDDGGDVVEGDEGDPAPSYVSFAAAAASAMKEPSKRPTLPFSLAADSSAGSSSTGDSKHHRHPASGGTASYSAFHAQVHSTLRKHGGKLPMASLGALIPPTSRPPFSKISFTEAIERVPAITLKLRDDGSGTWEAHLNFAEADRMALPSAEGGGGGGGRGAASEKPTKRSHVKCRYGSLQQCLFQPGCRFSHIAADGTHEDGEVAAAR